MRSYTKDILIFTVLVVTFITFLAIPTNAYCISCGFKPFKPFVPIGCKDLVSQCVCDDDDCYWQWVCVQ